MACVFEDGTSAQTKNGTEMAPARVGGPADADRLAVYRADIDCSVGLHPRAEFDDLSSADTNDWGNKERLAVFDTDKLSRSNGPPQSWFLDNTGGPPYPGEVSFFGDQCFRGFDNGGRVDGGMLVYSFLNSMVYFPSEQWTW